MKMDFEIKYQQMLSTVKTEVSKEVDISKKYGKCQLILWNDNVNDMNDVSLAIYQICKLSDTDAINIMLEAHNKGKAVLMCGMYDDLKVINNLLTAKNITTSINEI